MSSTITRPGLRSRQPYLTIRPVSGWSMLNLRELLQFRDLLWTLAVRDLKVRYKQTALGVLWVVLQPLFAAGVFTFVFGTVARLETPGAVPYFLFSFAGLVAWNLFAGTLARISNSLVSNSHLVAKVYFPRLLLPFSSIIAVMVDFLVALTMLAVLLATGWHLPDARVLLMFGPLLILLLIATGAGLWITSISVWYRDAMHILPVLVQFLLFASPIAYSVDSVPDRFVSFFYLNPLVAPLETFRWCVIGVGSVPVWPLAYSAVVGVLLFIAGAISFTRTERTFADVI